jgi:hypothetical protein
VARHLAALGIEVEHIHADGHVENQAAALGRLMRILNLPEGDLFHSREEFLDEAYRIQEGRIAYAAVGSADGVPVRGAAG